MKRQYSNGATARERGRNLDFRAGVPRQSERIASDRFSYFSDIATDVTTIDVRMGNMRALDHDVRGGGWHVQQANGAPTRQIHPIEIDGDTLPTQTSFLSILSRWGMDRLRFIGGMGG